MTHLFTKQRGDYTCGPTCLRICAQAFTNVCLTKDEANALCNTTSIGTYWSNLKKGFRRAGMKVCRIKEYTPEEWDKWINAGYYVVSSDDLTYPDAHVVAVYGIASNKYYAVADSAAGKPRRVRKDYIIKSCNKYAFAVRAKSRKNVQ